VTGLKQGAIHSEVRARRLRRHRKSGLPRSVNLLYLPMIYLSVRAQNLLKPPQTGNKTVTLENKHSAGAASKS
jgi:hypothetical protein